MENTALNAYRKAVVENFAFAKSANTIQEAYLRAIPIPMDGYLLPVCQAHVCDEDLLQKLTEWRNINVDVYPTQFTATLESTRAWMKDRLLAVPDRMLFLVVDNTGKVIGHIGFNGCHNNEQLFEIDNVVRGVNGIGKGLFAKAMNSLIEWARKTINVNGFFLRVMEDNPKAIAFYSRNSFIEESRIPLIRESKGEIVSYREAKRG